MAGGQDIRAGRAIVEIVLRNKVKQGLDKVASHLRTFGKLTASIGAGLSAASAGIIAPLTAAVSQFSAVGEAVDKMAARTGLSTEAVSELTYAADLSGTSIDSLEVGLKKMQDTVVSAARGGKEASLAFRRLGLSGQVLASMSPDKQLEMIADRIARIRNPALRTAVALDVFGKSGTELLPLLAEGAAGIQKMRGEAKRLGLSMDRETATSAAALNDALATVWATIKGVSIQVGAALAPTVTDLANRLSDLLGGVTKWVKENRGLVVVAAAGAIGLGILGAGLTALGVASMAASMAFTGLGRIIGGLGLVAGKASAALAAPFRAARERFVALWKSTGLVASGVSRLGQKAAVVASALGTVGAKGVVGLRRIAAAATSAANSMSGLATQGATKTFRTALDVAARTSQRALSVIRGGASSTATGIANSLRNSVGYAAAFNRGFTGELVLATTKGNAAFNALGRGVRDVFNRLAPMVMPAIRPISTTFKTLWSDVSRNASAARATISAGWQVIPATVKSAVRPISTTLNSVWTQMKQGATAAQSTMSAACQSIPASIRQPLSRVGQLAQAAGGRAGLAFSAALRATSTTAGSAWTKLKTVGIVVANHVSQQIRTQMSKAFLAVRSAGTKTFAAVKTAGLNAMRSVAGATRAVGGRISSGLGKIGSSAALLGSLLGDALGIPFLSAIPLITAAVGAIGAALAALLSPVGLVAAAIAGGVYAFFRWTDAGKALFAQLKQSFSSIFAIAKQTVTGIASAIAAGDLKLAARIAWLGIKAVWQSGIAELQRLWPLIVEGANQVWAYISQAADQAAQFVAAVWTQLPTWLTGPLGQVGQLVATVAAWIGEQFRAIIGPVVETVMAIGNAIAAGEWGLAAEIAWTSIRAAFGSGVAWVTNLWTEFSAGLASIFDGAITGIRKVWNNVSNFIARQLVSLIGGIQKALDALSQVDPTGIADKLKASLAIDVQGTLKALEDDRKRFNTGLDQGKQSRDLDRGKTVSAQADATQQYLADLQKQRDDAMARVKGLAASGDAKDQSTKLATALAELQAAVNLAAEKKGSVLGDHSDKTDSFAGANEKIVEESAKVTSQGTFTAAAAAGLGIGGINDKSLRAQLDAADYLRQLVQLGKRGRLVFG